MQAGLESGLAGALGLGAGELVSMVGGGGKTSLLHLLAQELAGNGGTVITTTTTNMYEWELGRAGPFVIDTCETRLVEALRVALRQAPVAGAAFARSGRSKVAGLPMTWVDGLRAGGLADYVVVEADGSRGRPLKTFAPHEPAAPATTSTIAQVAGLDAIDVPLTPMHVHRAERLASILGVAVGCPVSEELFAQCLLGQIGVLRRRWAGARIVTVLNKAEGSARMRGARAIAGRLLASVHAPDAVVVASCQEGRFERVLRGKG